MPGRSTVGFTAESCQQRAKQTLVSKIDRHRCLRHQLKSSYSSSFTNCYFDELNLFAPDLHSFVAPVIASIFLGMATYLYTGPWHSSNRSVAFEAQKGQPLHLSSFLVFVAAESQIGQTKASRQALLSIDSVSFGYYIPSHLDHLDLTVLDPCFEGSSVTKRAKE